MLHPKIKLWWHTFKWKPSSYNNGNAQRVWKISNDPMADSSPLRTLCRLCRSIWTSGRRLADPPDVFFPRTPADLLRTPPESAADPKIYSGFAADLPQVRGRAVDFLVSKKPKKSSSSPKESESVCRGLFFPFWRTILEFGGQKSNCLQRIRCIFLVCWKKSTGCSGTHYLCYVMLCYVGRSASWEVDL